ncbi:MAG: hypothetical protein KA521_10385 [Crocinitomicaceae bacterium]|nr:hypothetical protein [Crocinitomicaceae bacterium]
MYKILFLFLINSFFSIGQAKLEHLFEELPYDTITSLSLTNHTAILPKLSISNESNHVNVNAIFDLLSSVHISNQFRVGGGLLLDAYYNKKWHLKFGNSVSYITNEGIFRPKSFVNQTFSKGLITNDFRGRLSFTPNSMFNFQIGLDHNFIGEGNRSLFISDYGIAYPFGQIRLKFWRIEYSVLYQFFREKTGTHQWLQKNGASHYLSFNATKWLNFGLFETVVFQPKDTLLNRGYELEYLNPVIFYRPQEYALGSSDNVLMGISFAAKTKKHTFYGQLIMDEFLLKEITSSNGWWGNKYGFQIGIKGRFAKKSTRFFYRTEFNLVRPYTYAHIGIGQNYGNQGNVLAHPYGANFQELVLELKCQKKRFLVKTFINYSIKGLDSNAQVSYGGNIYASYINRPYEYGNFVGQGSQNEQMKVMLTVAYSIHKQSNLQLFSETSYTQSFQSPQYNQFYMLVGFRSQLWNDYRNY